MLDELVEFHNSFLVNFDTGFHDFLVDIFGFAQAMRIEDLIGVFSGIVIGCFLNILWMYWLMHNVSRDPDIKHASVIKSNPDKNRNPKYDQYHINPRSPIEVVDSMLMIIWLKITRRDTIGMISFRRPAITLIIVAIILLFFSFLGIALIMTVSYPPHYNQ